jgi:hypothetical protein
MWTYFSGVDGGGDHGKAVGIVHVTTIMVGFTTIMRQLFTLV